MNRLILKRMQMFDRVAEAENGARAIEEAGRSPPDLILLDLLMPLMDGFEALPRLREMCPRARIIVLSMLPQDQVSDRVLDLGADASIDKSIDEQKLALTIRDVLHGPPKTLT